MSDMNSPTGASATVAAQRRQEPDPLLPPDRQLDAAEIRRLLNCLSSHLQEAGSARNHLMIVGGAALALMWEDRTTHDVDAGRRTPSVDFISMRFTHELVRAARLVAEAEGLPRDWLNGAMAILAPAGDPQPQVLHRSDCLTVEAPSAAVLLAMKLHAARGKDLEDAARLARGAGISDPDEMLALVADAYGADAATAETADFAERALALALAQDSASGG
ncbi:MAG: hypothetical protein F4Z00_03980 [Acidimicrobiaceae bacterium]|nr:hypothetical protein [Acidimicrobiaceae bacterium]MXZ64691.1 hypothetical protein [Acidimicrobiaceae bacterium]MYF32520.1 hypothetical protein [Acidimicrobiaceae bacterium]MYJ28658.1 hypothetical protein [Acidimicrobiaceae bacterium]MYJ83518.1 hypothetical protein [Acidimicrobiaceae bacterium]